MALSPHMDDKNRDTILKEIAKLKNEGTAQSKDKMKEKFNIDADGKPAIKKPNK